MRKGALLLALALLFTACKGDSPSHSSAPTTTHRRVTTSSTGATTTSTAPPMPYAPAPDGCDPAALTRATPRSDRTRYTVEATLDLAKNTVTGTIEAVFTPDLPTDQAVVRLWANGPGPAAHGARQTISNATLDGEPVGISYENATTAFLDTDDLLPGRAVTIGMSFLLALPGAWNDRLSRVGTTVRLGSWLPLLSWEPGYAWTLDPPTTANGEASTSIPADFDVALTTPPGLTVLATGTQQPDGRWTATGVPDWAATIGDFNLAQGQVGSVPITVGVDKRLTESPATYLNRVAGAIGALAARYGAYPWPAFTLAITPDLRGGIEYPGHVMQGPDTNARTTPHEAAHQWFYGLLANDQGRDPWVDEGLASWAEAVVNGSLRSFVRRDMPADGKNRIGEPMTYWQQHQSSYYRSVYVQTVQALNAIGVSPAAIDCALARLVAAYAYRVVKPADVARALETVAPNAKAVLAAYGAQRLDGP